MFASYVRKVVRLRRKLKIFERHKFFSGRPTDESGYKDIAWYTEQGQEFTAADWHDDERHGLAYCVYTGSKFVFAVFNGNFKEQEWKLPPLPNNLSWYMVLDSSEKLPQTKTAAPSAVTIPAWSVVLFETRK